MHVCFVLYPTGAFRGIGSGGFTSCVGACEQSVGELTGSFVGVGEWRRCHALVRVVTLIPCAVVAFIVAVGTARAQVGAFVSA